MACIAACCRALLPGAAEVLIAIFRTMTWPCVVLVGGWVRACSRASQPASRAACGYSWLLTMRTHAADEVQQLLLPRDPGTGRVDEALQDTARKVCSMSMLLVQHCLHGMSVRPFGHGLGKNTQTACVRRDPPISSRPGAQVPDVRQLLHRLLGGDGLEHGGLLVAGNTWSRA